MKKNIFTLMAAVLTFSACCSYEEPMVLEYTPEAIGNNNGLIDPPAPPHIEVKDADVKGIMPENPKLAGTLASRLASTYRGLLVVTVNGMSSPETMKDIVIRSNEDGSKINFGLKDLVLEMGGQEMKVGTIVVEDIPVALGRKGNDYTAFDMQKNVTIGPGSGDPSQWMGPLISQQIPGGIPITLIGEGNRTDAEFSIDIDLMSAIGQTIHVEFTTIDSDVPGIMPSDPSIEGTLASKLSPFYEGDLVVTVNGTSSPEMKKNIIIRANEDGSKINFGLKDLILEMGGQEMKVGTIIVEDIPVTPGRKGDDYTAFDLQKNITIGPGSGDPSQWMGPLISQQVPGGIPITLVGEGNKTDAEFYIDIDLESAIGQTIRVEFKTKK